MNTLIPDYELEIFKQLPDIKVVFDVGAREDCDYLDIRPDIELHAFEPNLTFFAALDRKVGDRFAHLNPYGLGDKDELGLYDENRQAFVGGEETSVTKGIPTHLHTLDWYVGVKAITKIDFLKIDTEGYDFKVLKGGLQTIPMCRFIQYEYWHNKQQFHELLEQDFYMIYSGARNVLCANKKTESFKWS